MEIIFRINGNINMMPMSAS